jgi:hypothetical protein
METPGLFSLIGAIAMIFTPALIFASLYTLLCRLCERFKDGYQSGASAVLPRHNRIWRFLSDTCNF